MTTYESVSKEKGALGKLDWVIPLRFVNVDKRLLNLFW